LSISVKLLGKTYGTQKAVDGISFEAKPGKILGFLGPNGAGKSTTMKMLTCYLPQTSGQASICGFDITDQSLEVRKIIGYLPESNPLYLDMYVREFLYFIGNIYHLQNIKLKVEEVILATGLEKEQHKKIGELSKGYKQRVGLAQAIIHNPQVLILDEPTSGLDPNQLIEIRKLIKELGKTKTVILSTHIMQEVEAICDDVIIINKGKIVANSSLKDLLSEYKETSLEPIFVKLTKE
jgi:ABC-2 type transport system ATP-binding protein